MLYKELREAIIIHCSMCVSGAITSDVLNLVCLARKRILGPFSPSFNVQDVLAEGLRKVRTQLSDLQHCEILIDMMLSQAPYFKMPYSGIYKFGQMPRINVQAFIH